MRPAWKFLTNKCYFFYNLNDFFNYSKLACTLYKCDKCQRGHFRGQTKVL